VEEQEEEEEEDDNEEEGEGGARPAEWRVRERRKERRKGERGERECVFIKAPLANVVAKPRGSGSGIPPYYQDIVA